MPEQVCGTKATLCLQEVHIYSSSKGKREREQKKGERVREIGGMVVGQNEKTER